MNFFITDKKLGFFKIVLNFLQVSKELTNSLNEVILETYRRKHLAYLMADQGALVGNPDAVPNLPKQHLARFELFVSLRH